MEDFYRGGDWNAVCFECGRKKKAGELVKHWRGYYVCPEHWEPRQPQDFVRAVPDHPAAPWVQSPADEFAFQCDLVTSQGVADYGVADCARADHSNPAYLPQCTMAGRTSFAGYAIAGCMIAGRVIY